MSKTIEQRLRGWGFDMEALKESEGAFSLSPPKGPRAFSTNVSNEYLRRPSGRVKSVFETCQYSGLRSTSSYME